MIESTERAKYLQRIKELEQLLGKNVWITLDELTEIVSTPTVRHRRPLLDRLRCHELTEEKTFKQKKRLLKNLLLKLRPIEAPLATQETAPEPEQRFGGHKPAIWEKSLRRRYYHVTRIQDALERLALR